MKIGYPYILFILIFYSISSCQHKRRPVPDGKPNIVLFLIDDFGYADISFEENTQINTPNIDRIAENGVRFSRFYQSSAACAPTRASVLTGRYHLETGVWGVHYGRDFIHRDETTIADVLRQAGYATGAFGKWHSGKTWSYFSWNRGFDVGVHSVLYRYFDTRVLYNNKLVNVPGPITGVVGDQAVKFIRENKDKPFFCYVPFQAIHEPFNCPLDVFQKYKDAGYTDHVARLYGMIEVMDSNVGKITNTLIELGLEENTMILFLSDDGPSPGFDLSYGNRRMNAEEKAERERGWSKVLRGSKAQIWEGGSITPFYVQWKNRLKPGTNYDNLSGIIDIFPTVLEACGIEVPENNLPIHGKSLWPVLAGKETPGWNERTYFDNSNFYRIPLERINLNRPQIRQISVHYQDYKLVRSDLALVGEDTVQYFMYNLKNDPLEKENIYKTEVEAAEKLKSEIDNWYEGVLNSGRAFKQAVYEVGNWEERATPINMDAVAGMRGTVKRSDRTEFFFDSWTPGSAMNFEIDVVEDGTYGVELLYLCQPEDLGSVFNIFTEFDTAKVVINDPNNSMSDTLFLPKGRQILTIEMEKMGNGDVAMDWMRNLVIHRLPQKEEVLMDFGFELADSMGLIKRFSFSSATVDFMTKGGNQGIPVKISPGDVISIKPFAGNANQISQVEFFLGFESIGINNTPPFEFSFDAPVSGRYTVTAEFTSKKEIKNAVFCDVLVN